MTVRSGLVYMNYLNDSDCMGTEFCDCDEHFNARQSGKKSGFSLVKMIVAVVLMVFLSVSLNVVFAGARPVDTDTGKPQEPKKPAPGMPDCIAPNDKGECTQYNVSIATDEDKVGCPAEGEIEDLLKCLDKKNGVNVKQQGGAKVVSSSADKTIKINANASRLEKIAAIKKVYKGKIEIVSISKKGAKVLTAQVEWVEITFKIK